MNQGLRVHAAAGGVHLAVQIAKARGAYVLGDVVLDLIGRDYSVRSLTTLRDGALLIAVPSGVPADLVAAAAAADRGLRTTGIVVEPDYAALQAVATLVDAGQLRVRLDTVFPFEDAATAHRIGEAGRILGKSVLGWHGNHVVPALSPRGRRAPPCGRRPIVPTARGRRNHVPGMSAATVRRSASRAED